MTPVSLAPDAPPPLAEWLEPSLHDTAGQDPLGFNTITLDRILPQLIPGILQLSERARYFSIYPWMLWQFAERKRPATKEELDHFIRRREYELCLAMKLCPHCDAFKAIGGNAARPNVNSGEDPFQRRLSVKSDKGGFGLYYSGPLADLGAIAPVGTALGAEDRPTPIEVLRRDQRALDLAESFHAAIEGSEYYKRYERSGDPIPRAVLEELAEHVCLCRLPERPRERDAIRELMFTPPTPEDEDEGACDARRRAFALFLSLLSDNPRVAAEDGEFWRGLTRGFLAAPTAADLKGETVAAWGALAMKECMQEAVCSIWTDFCRTGLEGQRHDGFSAVELEEMIRGLAAGAALKLGGASFELAPAESAVAVQRRAAEAARKLDWEDLRGWTAAENSAASGLVVLLVLAQRLPDPGSVHPLWGEIARRRADHQDGLWGVLSQVQGRLRAEPTVAELLEWMTGRFLIGPHEVIAYSKLPNATFRFHREETGRTRFFAPGTGGGLARFDPSDDRRGSLSSLSEDIGFWDWDEEDMPRLTPDGRAFVAEVLG